MIYSNFDDRIKFKEIYQTGKNVKNIINNTVRFCNIPNKKPYKNVTMVKNKNFALRYMRTFP